jgi:uncharacterized protein (TIGR03437 family)
MLRHVLMSLLLLFASATVAVAQDVLPPPFSAIAAGNAANFMTPVPPGGIVALFNAGSKPLADFTLSSNLQPLPTNLGGTQVFVEGMAVGLFFVSPQQINFLMPPLPSNVTKVNVEVVTRGELRGSSGNNPLAVGPNPGIFSANSSGRGAAAAVATADGLIYDATVGAGPEFLPIPIPVTKGGRPNFLILFGTGFHSNQVTVTINGIACPVTFVGAVPGYSGLTQINVQLVPELRGANGGNPVTVQVRVGGVAANPVTVAIAST